MDLGRRPLLTTRLACALALLPGVGLAPAPALAAVLAGDLNGDGSVDSVDEGVLVSLWNSREGDSVYDAAGDLDGDGLIGALDLAIFGAHFGATGGSIDTTPPVLFATLDDVPDDMNDILVVPPDRFEITLYADSAGGSVLDTGSLEVTSDHAVGAYPAGSDLGPLFTASPSYYAWEVPLGSDLDRTTHTLDVRLRDLAGNEAVKTYPFAVRDFAGASPFGSLQTVFLDFDQNRSLGSDVDFLEDLREFGLSTATPLQGSELLEAQMRDMLVAEIVSRVNVYYGLEPDGSPGSDSVNILFVTAPPGGSYSRLCVGGECGQGGSYLGAASLDTNNQLKSSDECIYGSQFGIFPHAIDNLWGSNAEYLAVFQPLDPGLGGVPVGADPLDATILDPGFDPGTATPQQIARLQVVSNAVDAFAQTVASAIAHETGHMLGLTARNAYPEGLWGGSSGPLDTHNVTPSGSQPVGNFLMNQGGSFSFEAITGRGGLLPPVFRALNWAYLRDRLVLDKFVYGLFPAPTLTAVEPAVVSFASGGQNRWVRFVGTNFIESPFPETPDVELLHPSLAYPDPVYDVSVVVGDPTCCTGCCMTGRVNKFSVEKLVYDVRLINGDGQVVVLEDGLEIQ